MSLEKMSVIDQITITEHGVVMWRIAHRIIEDGEQLSQSYERNSIDPGEDTARVPGKVKAIIDVVWTADVVDAFKAAQAEAKKQIAPVLL